MPKAIKLSDQLVADATKYARVFHRSPPKQIEYWATIGKISEENPDLPLRFVKRCINWAGRSRCGWSDRISIRVKVVQTGIFSRTVKKLHRKEKTAVDNAVRKLIADTGIRRYEKGGTGGGACI